MAEATISATANSLLGMATWAGFIAVINENATLITIGLTIVGLIMAFTFHLIGVKQKNRLTDEWRERESQRIKEKLLKEAEDN